MNSAAAEGSDDHLPELTLPGLHEELLKRILELPDISSETSILDLGCGSGAWLARLAGRGFKSLHGIDNQSFVPFPARSELPVTFTQADLDNDPDLHLGEAKFGLITAIEVIEHVHNPGRLLRAVSSHLSDKAYFLLTTPNVHSVRARLRFALTGKLAGFDPTNVAAQLTHLYPLFVTCLDRLLPCYGLKTYTRWSFPADRGGGTRCLPRLMADFCSMILPNEYPGDTLCVLIRRDLPNLSDSAVENLR
jgi:2-polyprenyl-3-methyl-5-hydroxy-6-metoxy-1,4-benzoquinol methylase